MNLDYFTRFNLTLFFDKLSYFTHLWLSNFLNPALLQYPRILLILDDEGVLSVIFNENDLS